VLRVLSAVTVVVLGGCGDGQEQCAPPAGIHPLRVSLSDEETSAPICDASVTARAGDEERSLYSIQDCLYVGGWRAGVYDIAAERDGYETATRSGVVVRDLGDGCGTWEVVTIMMPMSVQP